MKKILSILLFVCLAAVKGEAYEWTDANGVTWTFNGSNGTATITYASGFGNDVTVPQTVYNGSDAYTVEGISNSDGLFSNGVNITLPATIKSIGYDTFSDKMAAGTVKINAATPPTISDDSFGVGVTILVPAASLDAYRTADVWKDIAVRIISQNAKTSYNIATAARSNASGLQVAIGEDNLINVMSLTVIGTINSYDILMMRNKMFNLHHLDLTDATIVASSYKYYENYNTTDNVLGSHAFYNMDKLVTVKLPKSITAIDGSAFYDCDGLQSVETQDALKTIGGSAFIGCYYLKEIKLKGGLQSIGSDAFEDCSSLTSVTLPTNGSLQSIGSEAFRNCSSLTSVTLPANGSLQSIGSSAFRSCSSLTSITIPEGIKEIAGATFYNCEKLQTVILPSTVTAIRSSGFYYCKALTSISLPIKLTTIEYDAFKYSGLTEVHIPSAIRSIGSSAFSGCSNLKDYYVYTVEPTDIQESTMSNWTTATLHIPNLAYWNYYYQTQWSKFYKLVQDNSYQYKYFYLTQDITFDNSVTNLDEKPEVQLDGGSGMIVETTDKVVSLGEIHMANTSSIVSNGNMTAEGLTLEMTVEKNKWYFLSLPFRVKATNVSAPGLYAIRYYDGQERATNGSGGWKNYTGSYLQPKQGYIFQCNTAGTLTMKVEKADLDFSGGQRQNALTTYVASSANNASWNFLGNPHPSYFDIDETGYSAPITVWNGSSYVAVRPGDDTYHLGPMEGFFVQKPEGTSQIAFPAAGRHTLNQWADIVAAKEAKKAATRADEVQQRHLVDLTIASGETTADDKTRVVFNAQKSQAYEIDCDAAKFMSDQPVAQLWTQDEEHTQYAINERPKGEVSLGYTAAEEGLLTISAVRMDTPVYLRDNEQGLTHDLSLGGYTFKTAAGTNESRFTLVLKGGATAINEVEQSQADEYVLYNLGGTRQPAGSQCRGAYIEKQGSKARKVIKK